MTKFKPYFHACLGFFAAVGVFSLTHTMPAVAQSPGVSLASLQAKITDLQNQVDYLKSHPTPGPQGPAGTNGTNGKDGLNGINGKDGAQGPKGDTGAQGPQGIQGAQGPAGASPFTVSGTDVTLSGYNLRIVNGLGSTDSVNGLGNLTLGYNATGNTQGGGDVRTGSHNLVLGDLNNYSSYGGLVAGYDNTVSGRYASVSGGFANTASGIYASVSGGLYNTASGSYASVSGGFGNTSSGYTSSVTGGFANTASNSYASVSGGTYNTASGLYSSVSGGNSLTQSANYAWTGGSYHTP